MALTDINISEQLETGAPSIKYTGQEGPKPSPQHQEEMMIAKQIWEALGPEQQGQFLNFEEFFRSGAWKKILQQMQQDEMQGQGIESLGPRSSGGIQMASAIDPMLQEEYDKYVFEMQEQGLEPMSLEQFIAQIRSGQAQGGRIGARFGGDMEELSMRETIDTPEGIETLKETETMRVASPDWYIKRIEHLMFLGYSYDEAGEIAYDNDKYYEIVGDPGE